MVTDTHDFETAEKSPHLLVLSISCKSQLWPLIREAKEFIPETWEGGGGGGQGPLLGGRKEGGEGRILVV